MSEQTSAPSRGSRDAVVVEVGVEVLEHGHVRAELDGDGRLAVTKTFEGKAEYFEGRVDPGRAHELLDQATELRSLTGREEAEYRPVPDEAQYLIDVRREGSPYLELRLWDGELERHENAKELVEALRSEVDRASDGQAVL